MKFSTLLVGAALAVVPVQASIIITQTAIDPALALTQTFGAPSPSLAPNFTPVIAQFQSSPKVGVSFMRAESVVYDPNQVAGGSCTDFGSPDPSCVTNFTENADGSYKAISGTTLTFTLTNPSTEVAFFLLTDQISPTNPTTTQITVNGGLVPTNFSFGQGPWFDIKGNGAIITSVMISGLNASTAITGGHAYGLVLSHIETTTPEPGTILMLSAGLGAIGFFARRRKA